MSSSGGRRIRVRLFAVLRERAGVDEIELNGVPPDATVGAVKALVAERHPELGDLTAVATVVGTAYASPDTALGDADEVALLPPVSGGAPDGDPDGDPGNDVERGVFVLSADPLDPADLQARVAHPSCGGIVVFTGTTRDTNRGQDVAQLDYEAFEEMSGPEMRRIFDDCLREHGPGSQGGGSHGEGASGEGADREEVDRRLRMVCAHRVGTVGVGEPSVVIAVASPHRDAAFLAARFLIDTLKERLPVWKKEVYRDGHHWIGDRS
ncbi:MAG: molybdenum cofactor biosynthesis protein MoaE [Planctomycetota bacterium]